MDDNRPIIIKKIKKGGHGHHGGSWKVAYADFVTAMMAFFMLLWLLNVTTDEQKRGIADYFAPANVSQSVSGSGGVLGGTDISSEGARSSGGSPSLTISLAPPKKSESDTSQDKEGEESASDTLENTASTAFEQSAEADDFMLLEAHDQLQQAILDAPELAGLEHSMMVDMTPEGLRIQITDRDGRPMFKFGSSELLPHAELLVKYIAGIIQTLPNRISISGHTDGVFIPGSPQFSNWSLSAERAASTHQALIKYGVMSDRIFRVSGKAHTEPLFPDNPLLPANRRIGIILIREAPVIAPAYGN